jgi:hypothetical protein
MNEREQQLDDTITMRSDTRRLLASLTQDRVHILDQLQKGRRAFEVIAETGAPFDARLEVAAMLDAFRDDPPMMRFDKMLVQADREIGLFAQHGSNVRE